MLFPIEEEPHRARPYDNKGLFSEHYLKTRLRESPEWQEDPEPLRQRLLELYRSKEGLLKKANEAQTEKEFIQPVLDELGFSYLVQPRVGELRPDYILYRDEATKENALNALRDEEEPKLCAQALAILEAKYWGRDLDVKKKGDRRDRLHTPVAPSFQLSRYLDRTGVEWGILTNGREWRLYWGRATNRQNRYFAVHLPEALQDPEAFRFFFLFFRPEAFIRKAQGSFLERLLEESKKYGLRVGKGLKEAVFEEVFPLLAEGFLHYHQVELKRQVDESTLQETYRATLTLLYRLLFLLYAEDRDLLPVSDRQGYYPHSLACLREEVAQGIDQEQVYTKHSYALWERLKALFRIIDRGNSRLRVPPYNGGLFKGENHPFLEEYKVADAFLAPALDRLARQEDEDGKRRFVDYKYLSVRELGAVYEGLLEFRLELATEDLVVVREDGREVYKPKDGFTSKETVLAEVREGEPYLVNDKSERHASGSYYTPDYVVEYIIRQTLEPVIAKRKEALGEVLEEYNRIREEQDRHPTEEGAKRLAELRQRALEVLLDVKVVDPAMGSGHFLVVAVDYLSERFANLIAELGAEPVLDALAEMREEIKDQIGKYGFVPKDEQLSDINLLKRMVMKRCVFGVDLNEMAVELAKLSLWLDAFTVGAPLSFLDHHLRHGNSVLGVLKEDLVSWVEKNSPIWLSEIERQVEEATRKAQELLEVRDLTPEEVQRSQLLYAQAEEALLPVRQALDVYAAGFFAPKPKKGQPLSPLQEACNWLPSLKLSELAHLPPEHHLPEAVAFARERHFFHWEFEFPEVFFSPNRKDNPGFDAVVGNPPYVRQEQLGPNKAFFKEAYRTVYATTADLYTYFFARGLSVLRKGGRLGFISSRQFTRAAYGQGLRKLLTSHNLLEMVDFGENPVFEEANTHPAIFIVEKGPPTERVRFKAIGKQEFEALMNAPAEDRGKALARLVERGQDLDKEAFRPEGWTLRSAEENAILRKMEQNGVPLSEYVDGLYYGIKTGCNEAFFIDEATRNRLIQEDERSAELIKPLLVGEDVRRYGVHWPNDPRTQYLIFTRRGAKIDDYPAIKRHLERFRERLEPKPKDHVGPWPGRKPGKYQWYEIQDAVAYYHLLEGPKIVYPVIAKEPRFYLDREGFYYIDATLFFIPTDDPYLLAVLNSWVVFGALKRRLPVLGDPDEGGRLNFHAVHFQHFPIPRVPPKGKRRKAPAGLLERSSEEILAWAQEELAAGRRDTVADLLGKLALRIQEYERDRITREKQWREWVELTFEGAHRLGEKWLAGRWAQEGMQRGIEAITEHFKVKKVKTSPETLGELKKNTQEALEILQTLHSRVKEASRLIDRLVARLYGLSDEEAKRLLNQA